MTSDNRHNRYDFIDQLRGFYIAFLILSIIVQPLAERMLVPSLFTHGFLFFDFGKMQWNWMLLENQFYTWIDLGSSLFMLVSGVCIAISFRGHLTELGTKRVIMRMLLRYGAFVMLQLLFDVLTGQIPLSYRRILLGQQGFFTRLGIGTIAGNIGLFLVKSPTKRAWCAVTLLCIHGLLYLLPPLAAFHANPSPAELAGLTWLGDGSFFDYFAIPFEALSFAALALMGTCAWDWLDSKQPFDSFKKHHVPVGMYAWLGCFVVSWFIPFQNDDLVMSQTLLAIGAGYFFMIFFFCLERVIHFKLPLLSAFGRNGLLLYMSCLVFFLMLVGSGIYDAITPGTAWLGLLLVISVFVVLAGIATTLDKRKLYLHL